MMNYMDDDKKYIESSITKELTQYYLDIRDKTKSPPHKKNYIKKNKFP